MSSLLGGITPWIEDAAYDAVTFRTSIVDDRENQNDNDYRNVDSSERRRSHKREPSSTTTTTTTKWRRSRIVQVLSVGGGGMHPQKHRDGDGDRNHDSDDDDDDDDVDDDDDDVGECEKCPPYLIVSDGKTYSTLFLSSQEAGSCYSEKQRDDDDDDEEEEGNKRRRHATAMPAERGTLIKISDWTISTVLLCAGRHYHHLVTEEEEDVDDDDDDDDALLDATMVSSTAVSNTNVENGMPLSSSGAAPRRRRRRRRRQRKSVISTPLCLLTHSTIEIVGGQGSNIVNTPVDLNEECIEIRRVLQSLQRDYPKESHWILSNRLRDAHEYYFRTQQQQQQQEQRQGEGVVGRGGKSGDVEGEKSSAGRGIMMTTTAMTPVGDVAALFKSGRSIVQRSVEQLEKQVDNGSSGGVGAGTVSTATMIPVGNVADLFKSGHQSAPSQEGAGTSFARASDKSGERTVETMSHLPPPIKPERTVEAQENVVDMTSKVPEQKGEDMVEHNQQAGPLRQPDNVRGGTEICVGDNKQEEVTTKGFAVPDSMGRPSSNILTDTNAIQTLFGRVLDLARTDAARGIGEVGCGNGEVGGNREKKEESGDYDSGGGNDGFASDEEDTGVNVAVMNDKDEKEVKQKEENERIATPKDVARQDNDKDWKKKNKTTATASSIFRGISTSSSPPTSPPVEAVTALVELSTRNDSKDQGESILSSAGQQRPRGQMNAAAGDEHAFDEVDEDEDSVVDLTHPRIPATANLAAGANIWRSEGGDGEHEDDQEDMLALTQTASSFAEKEEQVQAFKAREEEEAAVVAEAAAALVAQEDENDGELCQLRRQFDPIPIIQSANAKFDRENDVESARGIYHSALLRCMEYAHGTLLVNSDEKGERKKRKDDDSAMATEADTVDWLSQRRKKKKLREGVSIIRDAMSTLYVALANLNKRSKNECQVLDTYEMATSCPLARSSGKVWLEYARFCWGLGNEVAFKRANKVFVAALVGKHSHDAAGRTTVTKGEVPVDDKYYKRLWDDFLFFTQERDKNDLLTLEDLKKRYNVFIPPAKGSLEDSPRTLHQSVFAAKSRLWQAAKNVSRAKPGGKENLMEVINEEATEDDQNRNGVEVGESDEAKSGLDGSLGVDRPSHTSDGTESDASGGATQEDIVDLMDGVPVEHGDKRESKEDVATKDKVDVDLYFTPESDDESNRQIIGISGMLASQESCEGSAVVKDDVFEEKRSDRCMKNRIEEKGEASIDFDEASQTKKLPPGLPLEINAEGDDSSTQLRPTYETQPCEDKKDSAEESPAPVSVNIIAEVSEKPVAPKKKDSTLDEEERELHITPYQEADERKFKRKAVAQDNREGTTITRKHDTQVEDNAKMPESKSQNTKDNLSQSMLKSQREDKPDGRKRALSAETDGEQPLAPNGKSDMTRTFNVRNLFQPCQQQRRAPSEPTERNASQSDMSFRPTKRRKKTAHKGQTVFNIGSWIARHIRRVGDGKGAPRS